MVPMVGCDDEMQVIKAFGVMRIALMDKGKLPPELEIRFPWLKARLSTSIKIRAMWTCYSERTTQGDKVTANLLGQQQVSIRQLAPHDVLVRWMQHPDGKPL
jgi:hypothetical protein